MAESMAGQLTTNHLNYIVWRYLQESGFGDAAVKLQRDWMANPQALPHADTVKNHMLITLVQKGLQLCELEQRLKTRGTNSIPESFFRAVLPQLPALEGIVGANAIADTGHGVATEHERKPNGVGEASDAVTAHGSSLTAAPSNLEHAVARVTTGASTGTQVEPVTELASQTAVLDTEVGDVLHTIWSPTDPTQLLTAGSETLSRIWKFIWSGASLAEDLKSSQVDAFSRNDLPWVVSAASWHPLGSLIAVAAYNNADIFDNQLTIWRVTGHFVATLPKSAKPVLDLRWSPSGHALLAACANDVTSETCLWDPNTTDLLDAIYVPHPVEHARWLDDNRFFLAGDRVLELHGFNGRRTTLLHRYTIPHGGDLALMTPDPVTQLLATATSEGVLDIWNVDGHVHSFSAHDAQVTALEWQPLPALGLGNLTIEDPQSTSSNSESRTADRQEQPRRLASASVDGTVRIWNGKAPWQCLYTLPLGRARFSVAAMAFSPDGSVLAAASWGKVLMWDLPNRDSSATTSSRNNNNNNTTTTTTTNQSIVPKSSWESPGIGQFGTVSNGANNGAGPNGSAADGDHEMADESDASSMSDPPHETLAWNMDGSKLAYAVLHQIAIIPYH